jgi:hypothetical protein
MRGWIINVDSPRRTNGDSRTDTSAEVGPVKSRFAGQITGAPKWQNFRHSLLRTRAPDHTPTTSEQTKGPSLATRFFIVTIYTLLQLQFRQHGKTYKVQATQNNL